MSGISESENPIEAVVEDDVAETKRGRYGWLSLVVAAIFGLFYAYDIWEAIGNLVALPGLYSALGLEPVPWWLLIVGVLIPPAVFLVAFWIGRKHNIGAKALVFLLGLAVVACLSLGVLALEVVLRPAL
jgi:hypothetical protein